MKNSVKRLLMLLLAVLLVMLLHVVSFSYSQEYINIPDPNFAAAVRGEMGLPEGAPIPRARAAEVVFLDLSGEVFVGLGITSLVGIEYFTALEGLLVCWNQLTEIDLSGNQELRWFLASSNQLTKINISNNPLLTWLTVNYNQLNAIDVSKNHALKQLNIDDNQLSSLIISNNPALEMLLVARNNLSNLDISNNIVLEVLVVCNNNLMTLDVSSNLLLEVLVARNNNLTTLDVSNNSGLLNLAVCDNNLTTLDVSNHFALEQLAIKNANLTMLDISSNPALWFLDISGNNLTTFNLSTNTELRYFFAQNAGLTSLDVSMQPELRGLSVSNNSLITLDLSNNPELYFLDVSNNHLSKLDVSKNPSLGYDGTTVFFYGNRMNSPDDVVGWQGNRHLNLNINFRFYPQQATDTPSIWAFRYVNRAVELGLVPRLLNRAFSYSTTRAEFTHFAVALYETITRSEISGRIPFIDTIDTNVQKAAYIGVVQGVGDGRFDPWGGLTREQAATMLARLAYAIGSPLPEYAATFSDNDAISSWAIDAVGQVQAAGIMSGVGNNMFDPQGTYTREQSIVTMLRLFDFVN